MRTAYAQCSYQNPSLDDSKTPLLLTLRDTLTRAGYAFERAIGTRVLRFTLLTGLLAYTHESWLLIRVLVCGILKRATARQPKKLTPFVSILWRIHPDAYMQPFLFSLPPVRSLYACNQIVLQLSGYTCYNNGWVKPHVAHVLCQIPSLFKAIPALK